MPPIPNSLDPNLPPQSEKFLVGETAIVPPIPNSLDPNLPPQSEKFLVPVRPRRHSARGVAESSAADSLVLH